MPDQGRAGDVCAECAAQDHEACSQPQEERPIDGTSLTWKPCCCFEGVRQEREVWREVGWLRKQMDAARVEEADRPDWMKRADETSRATSRDLKAAQSVQVGPD